MEGTQVHEMAKIMQSEFNKYIQLPMEELTLKRHAIKNNSEISRQKNKLS